MTDAENTTRQQLREAFHQCGLHRDLKPEPYADGEELSLQLTGIVPQIPCRAKVTVEKFIGGGFAGQVYKIRLDAIESEDGGETIDGLEPGRLYAMKILVPPSSFSVLFRDAIYKTAYQSDFAAQVDPNAMRSGSLWQLFIRRAASLEFGDEKCVVRPFAHFFDERLHACGELSEWVEGRTWHYEIDEDLFARWKGSPEALDSDNSPEYLEKKRFMKRFVAMLHQMGAPEFARQYEWWSMKSQPNVLKRLNDDEYDGLTAIDFRAGLALLFFLPMSPVDFRLIRDGIRRGHWVQFDRGNLTQLRYYVESHREAFEDLLPVLDELETADLAYRASQIDLTHHGLKPLTDARLRDSIRQGKIRAWRAKGQLDEDRAQTLETSPWLFGLLFFLSLIPFFGKVIRKTWGNAKYRKHVKQLVFSPSYLWRAMRASRIEALMKWQKKGRRNDAAILRLVDRPVAFWAQRIVLGLLPASWHRSVLEPSFLWGKIRDSVKYTWKFYKDSEFREQWFLGELEDGRKQGMLSQEDFEEISGRIKDQFIQKYLKSVAIHLMTLPVTQLVALVIAIYAYFAFADTWEQGIAYATSILVVFQVLPFSPGSLTRGFYVVYLMISERDFHNYKVACAVSFWHYIGYLGFPLQMVAHYPKLARFMGGRWSTKMVHVVPVFGERGGLLEHFVFDLFFNMPISLRKSYRTDKLKTVLGILATLALIVLAVVILYHFAAFAFGWLFGN